LAALPERSTQSAFFDPASGDLMASSSLYGFRRWSLRPIDNLQLSRFRLEPSSDQSKLPDELGKLALSTNAQISAVVHYNEIYIFDSTGSAEHYSLKAATYYESLAISPDGKYLAARTREGGQIHIWDVARQVRVSNLPAFDEGGYFSFSPDGEWFVTSSSKAFRFWQVGTWQPGLELRRSGNQPGPMAFSRDGKLFAMSDSFSAIELVQLPRGESLARLESPDRRLLRALAFSPDSRRLAAASLEQLVMMWDLSLLTQELSKLNLQGKLPAYPNSLKRDNPVELAVEFGEIKPK
jgi:WD40 repeat protein